MLPRPAPGPGSSTPLQLDPPLKVERLRVPMSTQMKAALHLPSLRGFWPHPWAGHPENQALQVTSYTHQGNLRLWGGQGACLGSSMGALGSGAPDARRGWDKLPQSGGPEWGAALAGQRTAGWSGEAGWSATQEHDRQPSVGLHSPTQSAPGSGSGTSVRPTVDRQHQSTDSNTPALSLVTRKSTRCPRGWGHTGAWGEH